MARALSLRAPTPPGPQVVPDGLARPALAHGAARSVDARSSRRATGCIDQYEQAYLREALNLTSGNITRAAELAGVNRKFIQRAMKRLQLREDEE